MNILLRSQSRSTYMITIYTYKLCCLWNGRWIAKSQLILFTFPCCNHNIECLGCYVWQKIFWIVYEILMDNDRLQWPGIAWNGQNAGVRGYSFMVLINVGNVGFLNEEMMRMLWKSSKSSMWIGEFDDTISTGPGVSEEAEQRLWISTLSTLWKHSANL